MSTTAKRETNERRQARRRRDRLDDAIWALMDAGASAEELQRFVREAIEIHAGTGTDAPGAPAPGQLPA